MPHAVSRRCASAAATASLSLSNVSEINCQLTNARPLMMPRSRRLFAAFLILLCATFAVSNGRLSGQSAAQTVEWRTYGGDLASTRYSPLAQVTPANFNKLEVAWRFKTDPLGPRP